MNLHITKVKILTLFFLGFLLTNTANAEIAVVVNKNSPLTSITIKEAKRIFLGITKKLPDGSNIEIVDHADASSLKEDFYMTLTNKSVAQINSRWAGLVFSGQGIPPKQTKGNQGVERWLQENPNGIGYIDSQHLDSSVKNILTISK